MLLGKNRLKKKPPSDAPAATIRRDRPADIKYLVGATGSGKTFQAQRLLAAHGGRALVWDWKDDHHAMPTAHDLAHFARAAATAPRLRYLPTMENVDREFEIFCQVAWAVQARDPSTDCLLLVEELAEVTRPSFAPQWWRRIVVQGRVYGFTVVGTSQRPAYVDKSFTGNATSIRCGRLGELVDARTIGQRIGVRPDLIQTLPDRAAYVYDGRRARLESGN